MIDTEKVVMALTLCANGEPCMGEKYRTCPYSPIGKPEYYNCGAGMAAGALALLKEQESEWLEDSDPGQEYGTTWACRKCGHSIHKPFVWNPYDSGYKYCPHCGAEMKVRLDD